MKAYFASMTNLLIGQMDSSIYVLGQHKTFLNKLRSLKVAKSKDYKLKRLKVTKCRKDEWRMMISSCWGVLQTNWLTDRWTSVNVESLPQLKTGNGGRNEGWGILTSNWPLIRQLWLWLSLSKKWKKSLYDALHLDFPASDGKSQREGLSPYNKIYRLSISAFHLLKDIENFI